MVLFGQIFSASIIDEECGRFFFFFGRGGQARLPNI